MARLPQSIQSTIDMLVDVGLDTLIGALILSVLIAALTAGAYLWLRRGKSDVSAILVSLILVANLACLLTGAGFIQARHSARQTVLQLGGQEFRRIHGFRHYDRLAPSAWRRTSVRNPGPAGRSVNAVDAPPDTID